MKDNKKTLLVVEDDPGLQKALRWAFEGFKVITAEDRETAIAHLRRHEPHVVTLDLGLPPDPGGATEGLATLQEILSLTPSTKVIVVTGNNDRENAIRAIGLGAWLFFQKPVDPELLGVIVERAYSLFELEQENREFTRHLVKEPMEGIIATSPEMLEVCKTVEMVAPSDATTLLLGESGTGKEVFARALHALSSRSKQRFVAINCAAIPENLLESELFGYEKGAFTGAAKQTRGNIEYADGGTLFLDEVGDLPPPLQAKLLRFIQERVIVRVGGRKEIPIDIRVVCATHQKLTELMQQGRFREDLYYRISEIVINIPPLRERSGEAAVLANHFLCKESEKQKKAGMSFSDDALAAIEAYEWPGNVRELQNRIKRAVILNEGKQVAASGLELAPVETAPLLLNLRQVREKAESQALLKAFQMANGKISQAAKMLGITRPTFYALAKKYNLALGETVS
ncbi:MAG: PEP-CTERM-box response regulator transcription factor [Gammaproteobacteria bacterium]|nr:MAG: PEP-CTERM-box response regulator transcription factor [Gammaproteobacteria bacterium]